MFNKQVFVCILVMFSVGSCKNIIPLVSEDVTVIKQNVPVVLPHQEVQSIFNEQLVEGVVHEAVPEVVKSSRQSRQKVTSLMDAMRCGFDVECVVDVAEVAVRERRQLLLVEADTQFRKTNIGREVATNEIPSELATTVESIISRMTDMLKETVQSWFKGYQSEEEVTEEETTGEQDVENDGNKQRNIDQNEVSESRGKKKKKLKNLIKFLILGAVVKAKITVLLQLLSAALQIKFFFIALAGLLINKIRLWYDLKKGHNPQKVIYYEHAQHQHHYDHAEDEHGGGSGGFWGRAYEVPEEEKQDPQNMAYRGQRPIPLAKH